MAGKKKYYAVVKGRKLGIYTHWFGPGGAHEQVDRFAGAIYKGFTRRDEALTFLKSTRNDENEPHITIAKNITTRQSSQDATSLDSNKAPVLIFTDGSALGNPGPGGYGAIIVRDNARFELSGGFRRTTNNRMELMACIVGLEQLTSPAVVRVTSDSRYVVDGIAKGWAERWQKNNWMRTKTEPALNADLWQRLLALCRVHSVAFKWIKGHAGHPENERCDQLAVSAASQSGLPPDTIYEENEIRRLG